MARNAFDLGNDNGVGAALMSARKSSHDFTRAGSASPHALDVSPHSFIWRMIQRYEIAPELAAKRDSPVTGGTLCSRISCKRVRFGAYCCGSHWIGECNHRDFAE